MAMIEMEPGYRLELVRTCLDCLKCRWQVRALVPRDGGRTRLTGDEDVIHLPFAPMRRRC